MPYPPNDGRHAHLPLIRRDATFERRGRQHYVPPPDRGGRPPFARQFKDRLDVVEQAARSQPSPPTGIQPHLVLKLPVSDGANLVSLTEQLERAGVTVVSIEPDRAVVAFREDQDLSAFQHALDEYAKGPRINERTGKPNKTTPYDVFEYVETDQVALWSKHDRIGLRLREAVGVAGERINPADRYVVEAELWHRGTRALAEAAVAEIRLFVGNQGQASGDKLFDWYVGQELCLVKVGLSGSKLQRLLELPIVAEVDLPPVPVFSSAYAAQATSQSFPQPPPPDPDGPRVCILDSGIVSGHPLLRANVGHTESVLSSSDSPADEHGHGTRVGGIAVFGDVRACYVDGTFSSPITLFSARILNERNQFDDERLVINQIRDAIRLFSSPPHSCPVFNLSLGSRTPSASQSLRRQTAWAEALDIAAREFGVLLVVSAGNNSSVLAGDAARAEAVARGYPQSLMEESAWLADPATSALALTVGAIAQHDLIGVRSGAGANDLASTIASADEPSPFTRVGPGIGASVKPDFVAYGGNVAWMGTGNHRRIQAETATSVMSLSRMEGSSLFSYDIGTSYAAPRVARIAALARETLKRDLGIEPHPNLIRAVLSISATVPPAADRRLAAVGGEASVQVCGYGMVDEEIACKSGDRWVTLVDQGTLSLNYFRIYEIPVPTEFKLARGQKRIRVGLAFDPPVRRRRQDYLGAQMDFMVIRGKTPEQIAAAYSKLSANDEPEQSFSAPYRVSLDPPLVGRGRSVNVGKGTLIRSEFRFTRERTDYGPSYWLVVRALRRWAPETIQNQSFGLAVSLIGDDPNLYQRISARVLQRTRARR